MKFEPEQKVFAVDSMYCADSLDRELKTVKGGMWYYAHKLVVKSFDEKSNKYILGPILNPDLKEADKAKQYNFSHFYNEVDIFDETDGDSCKVRANEKNRK